MPYDKKALVLNPAKWEAQININEPKALRQNILSNIYSRTMLDINIMLIWLINAPFVDWTITMYIIYGKYEYRQWFDLDMQESEILKERLLI